MSKVPSLVVDTNVWLDLFLFDRPGKPDTESFLRTAILRKAELFYPARILCDAQYIVEQSMKAYLRCEYSSLSDDAANAARDASWSAIEQIDEIATAIGLDQGDVWVARKYRSVSNDLEDNFVIAAAQRAGADFIVTNDLELIAKSPVAAMTPKDMAAYLQL